MFGLLCLCLENIELETVPFVFQTILFIWSRCWWNCNLFVRIYNIVICTLPARFLMLIGICIAIERNIVFFPPHMLWKFNFIETAVFWFPVALSLQKLHLWTVFKFCLFVWKVTDFISQVPAWFEVPRLRSLFDGIETDDPAVISHRGSRY